MFDRTNLDTLTKQLHEKLHHKFLSTYGAVYLNIDSDHIVIHIDLITRDDLKKMKEKFNQVSDQVELKDYPKPPFNYGIKATLPASQLKPLLKNLDLLPDLNTIVLDDKYFKAHNKMPVNHGPPPGALCMPRPKHK